MRTVLLLALAAALVAGCGGAKHGLIERSEAPKLVLQASALPRTFTQFDGGKQVMADRLPGPRFDVTRFGRLGGWKSRFRRAGTRSTRGPLVVESRLDLFDSTDGAKKDFAAYLGQFAPLRGTRAAGFGDEARTFTSTTGSGIYKVRYITVVWADRNATASVSANGFDGKLRPADVLRLARAQARAMARA
jgi:hypothetical protein